MTGDFFSVLGFGAPVPVMDKLPPFIQDPEERQTAYLAGVQNIMTMVYELNARTGSEVIFAAIDPNERTGYVCESGAFAGFFDGPYIQTLFDLENVTSYTSNFKKNVPAKDITNSVKGRAQKNNTPKQASSTSLGKSKYFTPSRFSSNPATAANNVLTTSQRQNTSSSDTSGKSIYFTPSRFSSVHATPATNVTTTSQRFNTPYKYNTATPVTKPPVTKFQRLNTPYKPYTVTPIPTALHSPLRMKQVHFSKPISKFYNQRSETDASSYEGTVIQSDSEEDWHIPKEFKGIFSPPKKTEKSNLKFHDQRSETEASSCEGTVIKSDSEEERHIPKEFKGIFSPPKKTSKSNLTVPSGFKEEELDLLRRASAMESEKFKPAAEVIGNKFNVAASKEDVPATGFSEEELNLLGGASAIDPDQFKPAADVIGDTFEDSDSIDEEERREDLADKPEEVVDDENANNMIEINGEVMTPGHFFSQRNPPMGAIDAESNKMTPARRPIFESPYTEGTMGLARNDPSEGSSVTPKWGVVGGRFLSVTDRRGTVADERPVVDEPATPAKLSVPNRRDTMAPIETITINEARPWASPAKLDPVRHVTIKLPTVYRRPQKPMTVKIRNAGNKCIWALTRQGPTKQETGKLSGSKMQDGIYCIDKTSGRLNGGESVSLKLTFNPPTPGTYSQKYKLSVGSRATIVTFEGVFDNKKPSTAVKGHAKNPSKHKVPVAKTMNKKPVKSGVKPRWV